MLNQQGRVTKPIDIQQSEPAQQSFSGNSGLMMEEPLIFEQSVEGKSGVDLPDTCPDMDLAIGDIEMRSEIGLPSLSEPQVLRHFTRLSQKNYSIDAGLYPLGSCTMKHNPRLNEKIARFSGFADIHPLQPQQTVKGALKVMEELSDWLLKLTGMQAVTLSPAAGAHGEFCGMAAIHAALEASGRQRKNVLVPDSAHGTNPASATALGYKIISIPSRENGRVDTEKMIAALDEDTAAIMLTNPNTCGLFEVDILKIAGATHKVGAYFYCDGANFNAIIGKVRPADLGIDAMHLNLHKTFSTPHGGGGPGSGPVVFSEALARFGPRPYLHRDEDGLRLVEDVSEEIEGYQSLGRIKAFHGQVGMFTRALAYMMSHGADGLRQVAEDAVLSANYIKASLMDIMQPSFDGFCMHECLFDESFLKGTGVTVLDFAKALIDEGYHPMTIYFPLIVKGAMLIEPTETESKAELDRFIGTIRSLIERAQNGDINYFKQAPQNTPRRRLDETRAARKPILRYQS